jgi:hypothetical protein
VYEEKYDGWRIVALKEGRARLVSRNGRDLNRAASRNCAAVAALDLPTLNLDGKIAVFDRQHVSHLGCGRPQVLEWVMRAWSGRPKPQPTTRAGYSPG